MGHLLSVGFVGQLFPPKATFDANRDIPDLTGKVIIVTGGNTGIGKETIKVLLTKNAKVYMAARSKEKAEAAIRDLKVETGKEALFLQLDLADLAAVTKAANEFKSKETSLHVLFNNGGVMMPPIDMFTADGYDLQFGTNVLGHAHFTLCLIPELIAGAQSSPDGKARVINTSSCNAYFIGSEGIQYETLKDHAKRKKLGPLRLYCQSKFGNILFSDELARRYADQGIISNAVHPGSIETEPFRHKTPFQRAYTQLFLYPGPLGALTQLWAGTTSETKDFNGQFLIPWARLGTAGRYVKMPGHAERLWEWIEEQRKVHQ